jgi:DNA-binding FadR family transcriptional regulator
MHREEATQEGWSRPVVATLGDQVSRAILTRIAAGTLMPGDHLPSQRHLARTLGVGLAVVREAIQRLEALGVLAAEHGSGTVVCALRWSALIHNPSLFDLAVRQIGVRDMWEARRLIEGQIVRLAAERATAADLASLRDIVGRADPVPLDYGRSQELNREFHLALARAGQNTVLEDMLAPLLQVRAPDVAHRFTADVARRTWAAHQAIVAAVAARNVRAAERAMVAHFRVGPIALDVPAALGPRARKPVRRRD